jgi:hypothetical protein
LVVVPLELALELWLGFLQHCLHLGFPFLFAQQWVELLVQLQVLPPEPQQEELLVTPATSTRRRSLMVREACLGKQGRGQPRSLRRQWTLYPMQSEFSLVALVALLNELSAIKFVAP